MALLKHIWLYLFLALFFTVEAAHIIGENNHDIVRRADSSSTAGSDNKNNNNNDGTSSTTGTTTADTSKQTTSKDIPLVSQSVDTSKSIPIVSQFVSSTEGKNTGKTTVKETGSDTSKQTSKETSKQTGKTTSTEKTTKKTTSTTSTTSTSISIDPRLPAGGITMVTPNPTSETSTYIKIGQTASFEWTYTSLSITPKALDVLAYCSINSQTYTVTTGLPAKQTTLKWDTKEWAANNTINLMTSQYTLYIFDSASNTTAIPQAGRLATFEYPFGMYLPQSYTPWAGDSSYVNMAPLVEPVVAKWLIALTAVASYTAFHIIMS